MNTEWGEKKIQLEEDRVRLLAELKRIGRHRDAEGPDEWVPKIDDLNMDAADDMELAEKAEEFGERVVIEEDVEEELRLVTEALLRIANGTYGTCATCGKDIEEARLAANPSAATCIAHK